MEINYIVYFQDSLFYKYIAQLTEIIGGDKAIIEKLQDVIINNKVSANFKWIFIFQNYIVLFIFTKFSLDQFQFWFVMVLKF